VHSVSPLSPYETGSLTDDQGNSVASAPESDLTGTCENDISTDLTDVATGSSRAVTYSTLVPSGPPEDLTVTPRNGQLGVSWSAPVNDGGLRIAGYRVSLGKGLATCHTRTTSCTLRSLSVDVGYKPTVAAINGAGPGRNERTLYEVYPDAATSLSAFSSPAAVQVRQPFMLVAYGVKEHTKVTFSLHGLTLSCVTDAVGQCWSIETVGVVGDSIATARTGTSSVEVRIYAPEVSSHRTTNRLNIRIDFAEPYCSISASVDGHSYATQSDASGAAILSIRLASMASGAALVDVCGTQFSV
jgi:hypothetical protein